MVQMDLQFEEARALWREDSAVWAIIAGELLFQHNHPLTEYPPALIRLGASRADEAGRLLDSGELDAAGHTLIGCTLALALAARTLTAERTPIEAYASELAEALSWQASEPAPPDLARLAEEIHAHEDPETAEKGPSLWELALRAGGHAVGLSAHITRRRQRRDLIDPAE